MISILILKLLTINLVEINYGDQTQSENSFLDYFGIIINIIAILLTWGITRHFYKAELNRLEKEEKEITKLQIDQFNFHLELLIKNIKKQILDLNPIKIKSSDKITYRQSLSIEFLNNIEINTIAKYIYRNNPADLQGFRETIFHIGLLSNLPNNLKEMVESFNQTLVRFEDGFYNYRHLLYREFIELAKERNISSDPERIKFKEEDKFISRYASLRELTFDNEAIIKDNILLDRKALVLEFIIPFLQLTSEYFLTEAKANQLNQIANSCKISFEEIEKIREIKAQKAKSQRSLLIKVYKIIINNRIKNYP